MAEGKGHTELLPCPFCNSQSVDAEGWMGYQADGVTKAVGPACDECGASAETVERWNTRAAVNTYPAVEGLVKALEEIAEDSFLDDFTMTYVPTSAAEKARAALSRFRSLQNGGAE